MTLSWSLNGSDVWGWTAGRQETAEFEILSTFLSAAWLIPRHLMREIEYRLWNRRHPAVWLIELTTGEQLEVRA